MAHRVLPSANLIQLSSCLGYGNEPEHPRTGIPVAKYRESENFLQEGKQVAHTHGQSQLTQRQHRPECSLLQVLKPPMVDSAIHLSVFFLPCASQFPCHPGDVGSPASVRTNLPWKTILLCSHNLAKCIHACCNTMVTPCVDFQGLPRPV